MARRRSLTEEEQALWKAVAKTLRPMHGTGSFPAEAGAGDATGALPPAAGRNRRGLRAKAVGAAEALTSAAALPENESPGEVFRKALEQAAAPASLLRPFRLGERAVAPPKTTLPTPVSEPVRMDPRSWQKLLRGKMAPEARIDLHGMTLSEAHPELISFLLSAQTRGLRLVLVITGKGKAVTEPVPRPVGALRHQVPHWLRLPPLGMIVQQVSDAHLKHGGAGAFYVWLRRR